MKNNIVEGVDDENIWDLGLKYYRNINFFCLTLKILVELKIKEEEDF